jgi:hypothetical protein
VLTGRRYARRDDDDRHAILTTPPEKGLETGVEDDVCAYRDRNTSVMSRDGLPGR